MENAPIELSPIQVAFLALPIRQQPSHCSIDLFSVDDAVELCLFFSRQRVYDIYERMVKFAATDPAH